MEILGPETSSNGLKGIGAKTIQPLQSPRLRLIVKAETDNKRWVYLSAEYAAKKLGINLPSPYS